MEFEQSAWLGCWVNFETCIDSEEPAIKQCWADAETAQTPMFQHSVKNFWHMVCSTVNSENSVPLWGWRIESADPGIRITWIDAREMVLGTASYIHSSTIMKGLEARPNVLFAATDAPAEWPFRYLLTTVPTSRMPEADSLPYIQFQFGSHINHLLVDGTLCQPTWCATMYAADGSLLERCNLIRRFHGLPTWSYLPQIGEVKQIRVNRGQITLAHGVCRYLKEHLHTHITTEELAKQFGVSQSQLKVSFRGVYGVSVQAYHRELKIRTAAQLLRTTERTVLDIAGEFGYANGSKFAAAFQRVMGMTPNEYRMK